jgi:uncharacterized membrane protein
MSATLGELLDLAVRWVHVIAGIMWVGNSLLFNWLDRNLEGKTIWLLHSGGFYYVEKSLLEGRSLPKVLHWFKWQSYITWMSGAVLLVVVYYLGGRATLEDPSVASLTHGQALLVGIGAVAGGWALYESMQRFVASRWPALGATIWVVGLAAISILLTRVLSGRAAFLHVGAMLGTIMAGNVRFTIIPSQRELVSSVASGGEADPVVSARAKRVSIHNNYFTFPVIALMVSNHFPAIYGHRWNWLLMFVIIASGALVRHIMNVRFTFQGWRPALGATILATAAVLFFLLRVGPSASTNAVLAGVSDGSSVGPVTFADVRHIIDRRCAVCHSARPTDLTFGAAPAGVMFDTPEQIAARAARIRERAVATKTMPPANRTGITDGERAVLGRWVDQGSIITHK